jgi:hypothetical protein
MVRASSEEYSARAKKNIQTGLDNLDLPGISHKFNYIKGVMSAVMNDPTLVRGSTCRRFQE